MNENFVICLNASQVLLPNDEVEDVKWPEKGTFFWAPPPPPRGNARRWGRGARCLFGRGKHGG